MNDKNTRPTAEQPEDAKTELAADDLEQVAGGHHTGIVADPDGNGCTGPTFPIKIGF